MVKQLLPCFEQTADALPKLALGKRIAQLTRQLEDLTALQKAHRENLLALDRSAGNGRGVSESSRRSRPRR